MVVVRKRYKAENFGRRRRAMRKIMAKEKAKVQADKKFNGFTHKTMLEFNEIVEDFCKDITMLVDKYKVRE